MKVVLSLISILISNLAFSEGEITCQIADGYDFSQKGKISISRSFSEHREFFTLCADEKESDFFVILEVKPKTIMTTFFVNPENKSLTIKKIRDHNSRNSAWVIWVDTETYTHLNNSFYKLQENFIDDSLDGLDGSTWCLISEQGESCVWAPSVDSKNRGYETLVALGHKLWSFFKSELKGERLY